MAKILKGKNPEDAITEKMIQNGIKKYGGPVSSKEWDKTRKTQSKKTTAKK